ncbi:MULTISPECIES: lytic transglycosylase domain-containing protein [Novosphingobium]|uniref:lytic transglycosylase domain-containing protein n=1 Tax=Novosphingobium TaxID=165696 RepID=UPI0022F2706A|nr:lytic transglycosylase domain-containing protein [Novosphingobium resinovorum]GLK47010.1 hypothetical protein GCM10017612_49320 [Novosphingobium resinovorum]
MTDDPNRMPVHHCRRATSRFLGALMSVTLAIHPCSAAAVPVPVPVAAGEIQIARCIGSVANGRVWLERTLWGLRDQEAGWIGAEVRNSNGTHDLGPLQVNSWWVQRISELIGRRPEVIRSWLANDACFNVRAANWIFLSGLAVSKDYWRAVGIYHSPTRWRQARYAHGVAVHMRRRFGEQVFATSTANLVAAEPTVGQVRIQFPKVP